MAEWGGVKPIETYYNGYRFRSRLEARWAVFFDAMGMPYEYEKEGFDLDGDWYLPDFYLPDEQTWVEIKGSMDQMERGVGTTHFLAAQSGYVTAVFVGPPHDWDGIMWLPLADDEWRSVLKTIIDRLTKEGDFGLRELTTEAIAFGDVEGSTHCGIAFKQRVGWLSPVMFRAVAAGGPERHKAACEAAKQARFERHR